LITSSNHFERWLISVTDMPDPAKLRKDSWISSNTGRGRAAGPALKLWILSAFIVNHLHVNVSAGPGPRQEAIAHLACDPVKCILGIV
jgi:hypothetical protein